VVTVTAKEQAQKKGKSQDDNNKGKLKSKAQDDNNKGKATQEEETSKIAIKRRVC
jgi:hypothetical protein